MRPGFFKLLLMIGVATVGVARAAPSDFADFSKATQTQEQYLSTEPPTVKWSGVTASGNSFTYFQDGSGDVSAVGSSDLTANWSIGCKNDAMTDARSCTVSNSPLNLFFIFAAGKFRAVCALGHDFPGRVAQIRVGDSKPVSLGTSGCIEGAAAVTLAAAIHPGTQIRTRIYKFPYDYPSDASGSADTTYPDMIRLVTYLYSHRPSPTAGSAGLLASPVVLPATPTLAAPLARGVSVPPRLDGALIMPPYPPISIRLGEEGVTQLNLTVDPRGIVIAASVVKSSGSERLDQAAADFARSHWRFVPAMQAGAAVTGSITESVTWSIH